MVGWALVDLDLAGRRLVGISGGPVSAGHSNIIIAQFVLVSFGNISKRNNENKMG